MPRAVNPMKTKTPCDTVPGWVYEILCYWRDKETGQSETSHLGFEHTLADARCSLELEAKRIGAEQQVELRHSYRNAWVTRGEDQVLEVYIRPVIDIGG